MKLVLVATFCYFTFQLLGVTGQGDGTLLINTSCCTSKTVAGILYYQVPGDTAGFPSCKADCVYERDDEPGSRYCFQEGDDGSEGAGEAQCIEPEMNFGKVGMTYSERLSSGSTITDWMAFNTSSGVLKCDIGFDIHSDKLGNIDCAWGQGGTEISSGNATVDTIQSEDNSIMFQMLEHFIHCLSGDKPSCKIYHGQKNVVYVQNAAEGIHELGDCIGNCTAPSCTFWTFSSTKPLEPLAHDHDHDHDHDHRVKRNHLGISECGIRNYTAKYHIPTAPSQYCGQRGNNQTLYDKTYVQDVCHPRTCTNGPEDCARQCNVQGCRHWTYSYKSYMQSAMCILSTFKPERKVNLTVPYDYPGLISSCRNGGNTCFV